MTFNQFCSQWKCTKQEVLGLTALLSIYRLTGQKVYYLPKTPPQERSE